MYLLCLRRNNRANGILPSNNNGGVVINGGYAYDEHENNVTVVTEMDETTISSEANKTESIDKRNSDTNDVLRSVTPDVIPKFDKRSSNDSLKMAFELNRAGGPATYEPSAKIEMVEKQAFRLSNVKFDEIISVEDVKETCIEMKEPNGNVYFVEQVGHVQQAANEVGEENKDESIALEMLDSILDLEESPKGELENDNGIRLVGLQEMHLSAMATADTESFYELIGNIKSDVKPMDDSENVLQVLEQCSATNNRTDSSPIEAEYATVKRGISTTKTMFQLHSFEEQTPTNEIKHIPIRDDQEHNFKNHLSNLIGLKSEQHGTVKVTNSAYNRKSLSASPSLRHSKSVDEFVNSHKTSKTSPPSPNADAFMKIPSTSQIPTAPQFDPQLYRTIGNRDNNHNRPATAPQSIENEFEKAFKRNLAPKTFQDVQLRRVPKSEALNRTSMTEISELDDATRMTTIRERLEKILGQGPPPVRVGWQQSYSMPAPDYPDAPSMSQSMVTEIASDESEMIHYRKPARPFDTVHKQKVLFNDVLKAISPDIRTSLHRTDSTVSVGTRTEVFHTIPTAPASKGDQTE